MQEYFIHPMRPSVLNDQVTLSACATFIFGQKVFQVTCKCFQVMLVMIFNDTTYSIETSYPLSHNNTVVKLIPLTIQAFKCPFTLLSLFLPQHHEDAHPPPPPPHPHAYPVEYHT